MVVILNTLKPLLADVFGIEETDVTPSASFEADFGADHEDMIEIAMMIEEEFDVLIDDEDLPQIRSVADLIAYIEAHGNE